MIGLSFAIEFVVLFVLAVYYFRKDKNNFIQPHAYYTVHIFVKLLLFPVIQFFLTSLNRDTSGVVFFNTMISLSYVSFSIGFFVKKKKGAAILNRFIKKFNIAYIPKDTLSLHFSVMVLIAILLFVYLTEQSGIGLLSWLLEPRRGFIQHVSHRGLGHLYMGSTAILNFVFLGILFFKVRKVTHLILATAVFVLIFYFYGNKRLIVFTIFEGVVYYNFFINKIKLRWAPVIFGLFVVVFSFVFSLYSPQDVKASLTERILRYADYYNNARMFFRDFDEKFEYAYGKEYLSGLWCYVPRVVYPNKPYSYGKVKYVTEKYYPDEVKSAHTPETGGPVEEYLNFGVIGVILISSVRGYFTSLFYRYFLKYRDFVGFVLLSNAMGFSIFLIVPGYKILWYVINLLLLLLHKQILAYKVQGVQGCLPG